MRNPENPNEKLEQAIDALRSDEPRPETLKAAGDRVWQNFSAEDAGAAPARPAVLPWKQELPKARPTHFKWLATAAAAVLAIVGVYFVQDWLAVPAGARASVENVDGSLYRVSNSQEALLKPGTPIAEGDRLRTSAGSRAKLRLRDGSLVEMNERAELLVSARRSDTTVHLRRGDIIVQAAKRRTGHLFVDAQDCLVSVTGTVFSVNTGLKGSRVSVIEGEVRVAQAGANNILHPGDQLATSAIVGKVPVREEIAWSADLDKHLTLLAEFAHLQNRLSTEVQMPGLRYQGRLLPLLPPSTMLFASIPNYGDALGQANQLFQQELQESAILREWFQAQQKHRAAYDGMSFDQVIGKVQQLSKFLGNEIVISMIDGDGERHGSPLLLAEVQRPGLKDFIEKLVAGAQTDQKHQAQKHQEKLHVVDEQELMRLQPRAAEYELVIVVRPDLVIAGVDVAALQSLNRNLPQGGGFANTPFGQRLSQAYQSGAGLLFGADLGQMQVRHTANVAVNARARNGHEKTVFDKTGFGDLRYLVAERKEVSGQVQTHAELAFSGPRRGIASWLAAPSSIGGLDFVSTNAGAVAAFVAKSPAKILDDLLTFSPDKVAAQLAEAEAHLKFRIREDLAATLGGEVTMAIDGPLLPTPSWKVIVEVNDPARLQQTLEQLVADAKAELHGSHTVSIEQATSGGQTLYLVRLTSSNESSSDRAPSNEIVELTYTFIDGYMVIGPTRAVVMNAIQIHQGGNSLARSSAFQALLPQDNFTGVSGLLYQNVASVVGPISSQLTPSQLQSLKAIAAETKPSVVCFYGEENAIRVSSTSRFFGLDLNTLTLSTLLNAGHGAAGGKIM
ncbi:MAG TPA: FecR domain-containing protein [Candidatus Saccharimonadales bacterium]|jgi:ferric-dicitrate binding protein FerR (iron transport regulator)|nr:FecR domain-containing protein [Candidatus Saccharimonadales bacterium]